MDAEPNNSVPLEDVLPLGDWRLTGGRTMLVADSVRLLENLSEPRLLVIDYYVFPLL